MAMATTAIWEIKATVNKSLAYIANPEKTQGGHLLATNCVADSTNIDAVYSRFLATYELARQEHKVGKRGSILAYHLYQSFDPKDHIDYETANWIGQQLATELTGNFHDWIVATHTDRAHAHNHIIFCANNAFTGKKFRCTPFTYRTVRKISDRLCREYGLNVVENPGHKTGIKRGELYAKVRGMSTKQSLAHVIDEAITRATTWYEFVELLDTYQVKVTIKGPQVTFHPSTIKKGIRGERLGAMYGLKNIMARIGRCEVEEFTIAQSLVEKHDDGTAHIRLPHYPDYFIAVDQAQLVLGRGQYRLYLPVNRDVKMFTRPRYGNKKTYQYHASTLPSALYQFFDKPTERTPRNELPYGVFGNASREERYKTALRLKTEDISQQMYVVQQLEHWKKLPENDQLAFITHVEKTLETKHGELQTATVHAQTNLDKGIKNVLDSARVEGIGREIRYLTRTLEELTKLRKQYFPPTYGMTDAEIKAWMKRIDEQRYLPPWLQPRQTDETHTRQPRRDEDYRPTRQRKARRSLS
ncbi:relaxase/mobilization nuclease domain-containing protein [Actinotignum urinale]|uniref:relaxase/mobilization nuclease domain-containing protein n=1 Tax=Actinotignum urinale TaxID=190146 RepID=UPI002A8353B8|nr:relaxase/mobilization nuclease domain-containing protein [Actinotignum urinale]